MPLPRRPRSRAGFTLIELTVVVVIMGLIAGIAIVSWKAMVPNQQLNTALRNLSEVLYGTRSDAIARSHEFRIYYDIDGSTTSPEQADTYYVRMPFTPDGEIALSDEQEHTCVHQTDLKKAGIDIVQVTVDDVTYTDGVVFVRFDPLGAASHHTVLLRQALFEREFTIEALPLTGEIRVHEGAFEREPALENDFK